MFPEGKPWLKPKNWPRDGSKTIVVTQDLPTTIRRSEAKTQIFNPIWVLLSLGLIAFLLKSLRERKRMSYFISVYWAHFDLRLGANVVFTDKAEQLRKDLELEVPLEKFMVSLRETIKGFALAWLDRSLVFWMKCRI